jgi:hypothetical protein
MAIQTSVNRRNYFPNDDEKNNDKGNHYDSDEEIEETEDDLIENYLYLTKRCGLLRHSPTTSALDTLQQQQNQSIFTRQYSWAVDDDHRHDFERSFHSSKSRSSLNTYNNDKYQVDYSITSRVPPTIYYNVNDDDNSFSLVKLFARMKTRLNHDRRYRPKSTHELLREEDSPEWFELTKNIRTVLTKALLPNGDYDTLYRQHKSNHRRNSVKKSHDHQPVLSKEPEEDENKIHCEIDDELNTEGDAEYDEIIWNKFQQCSRGVNYRRHGICKAIDRQQYQGQLVYVYGVANNILIDENLKASGLG